MCVFMEWNLSVAGVNDEWEDCVKTVIYFCRDQLEVEVDLAEIDRTHVSGLPRSREQEP